MKSNEFAKKVIALVSGAKIDAKGNVTTVARLAETKGGNIVARTAIMGVKSFFDSVRRHTNATAKTSLTLREYADSILKMTSIADVLNHGRVVGKDKKHVTAPELAERQKMATAFGGRIVKTFSPFIGITYDKNLVLSNADILAIVHASARLFTDVKAVSVYVPKPPKTAKPAAKKAAAKRQTKRPATTARQQMKTA